MIAVIGAPIRAIILVAIHPTVIEIDGEVFSRAAIVFSFHIPGRPIITNVETLTS
jgi:hypothetical protein